MKSREVLLKYLAFQVPGTLLVLIGALAAQHWLGLPGWGVGLVLGVWLLKEAVLFPLVRRAYDDEPSQVHALVGLRAEAQDSFVGEGYVLVRGELWRARLGDGGQVTKGEHLEVVDQRGLSLLVRKTESSSL